MAYEKGNFYHDGDTQVLDGITLKNATFSDATSLPDGSTISGVSIIKSTTVPTDLAAAPGTICVVVTSEGAVSMYLQEGTADSPDWNKVTTA